MKAEKQKVPWGTGDVAVLGIDPATRHLGLVTLGWEGDLRHYLQWDLPPQMGIEDRLPYIKKGLTAIITEEKPAAIAYEHGRGAFSAPELDVILRRLPLYCIELGYLPEKYSPSQWRMTVCGNGGLDKQAAWDFMRAGYADFRKIPEKAADARDAYGIARCWWERNRPGVTEEMFQADSRIVKFGRKPSRKRTDA